MNDSITEVEAERRADCALDVISRAQAGFARHNRRPAALTAREALAALKFEALLTWVAASNVRNGVILEDADFNRLTLAVRRIEAISAEVGA